MADNLRSLIVGLLTDALPADEWSIVGYMDLPTRVEKRTVAVWSSVIEPTQRLKAGQYAMEMTVVVLTPHQDVRKADDDLDGALLAVLDVLLSSPSIVFNRAERATNDDKTAHAWNVTVQQILTATPESPED